MLGGLVLAMGVLLFALWFSFDRFQRFDERFDEISQHRLPTLLKVSELQAAATELASLSADVLYPKGNFLFNNARTLIEQTQAKVRATVAELDAGEGVVDAFQRVGDTFLELVALREEQLAIRSRTERVSRRLVAIERELHHGADGQEVAAWAHHALAASSHFFMIRSLDYPQQIDQHRQWVEDEIQTAESAAAALPQAAEHAAALTLDELRDYAAGERNLFDLRLRDVELTRTIERMIYNSKHRMALLDEVIRQLHATTRQRMQEQQQEIQVELEGLQWLLGLVATAALIALSAIFFYVRRSVVARILSLQRAMQANMGEQLTPVPIQGNDELSLMACEVNHFIAEIQHREVKLKTSAEEAQAANQAKDEFLANISHEIRTPMNAILNLTQICLQDPLADPQRERLSKVKRACGYLLELINQILDFSRITAGQLELERLPFRLQELLESIDTHASHAEAKGLSFHAHIALGTPLVVEGDPLRIQQVLGNLLDNAIKFTDSGGVEVWIRVLHPPKQAIAEGVDAAPVWLEFSVKDTGIGISAEQLNRIFAPFSQADASTTRHYGGSGLGLSICQRLVQQMGGELKVQSTPGMGSRFSFALPLPVAEKAQTLADRFSPNNNYPAEGLSALKGRRVLLVEDNAFNQAVALELLERAGIQADVAENGRIAVQRAQEHAYDWVLMDIQMPEMDGYAASSAIRGLAGKENLPIIALTANAMDGIKAQCEASGMNDLVTKPIAPNELYDGLLRWLKPRPPSPEETGAECNAKALPAEGQTRTGVPTRNEPMAKLFLQHYSDFPQRLKEALAHDRQQALVLAHNMKSAAGTLGILSLAEQAKALEALLHGSLEAEIPATLITALEDEHRALVRMLS